jgi:hypothetical protein
MDARLCVCPSTLSLDPSYSRRPGVKNRGEKRRERVSGREATLVGMRHAGTKCVIPPPLCPWQHHLGRQKIVKGTTKWVGLLVLMPRLGRAWAYCCLRCTPNGSKRTLFRVSFRVARWRCLTPSLALPPQFSLASFPTPSRSPV